MLRHLAIGVGVLTTAAAQSISYPTVTARCEYDSQYLANPHVNPQLLWSQDVTTGRTTQDDWLQVHFRDTNLPAGSQLRIYEPTRPSWVQWHDASSLRAYGGWSCEFAGPTVRVELWGGANTTGNRVWIDRSRTTILALSGTDTLCDLTDDRVLSTDPRSCRLGSGCSAWLFSEYAVGTAGHCMSGGVTAGVMLHFNTPPSTAAGVPQPAHPNDQYALGPFLQFLDAGVGQDWSVMAALRNSNTQLFPGQAQGSWYTIAPPPAVVTGDLRVTGYGTGNGTSSSATASQMQKTHTGTWMSTTTPDALAYRVDTTGGNSGSPILLEATGEVIGVHTHGGCGNTSGANYGTASPRADWVAARQLVLALHTVGGFHTFGQGCGGAFGVPALSFVGTPELGRVFSVRITNLNTAPGLLGLLMIGFSSTQWSGGPLPASLASLGLQGCTLFVSDGGVDMMSSASGMALRSYLVPNNTAWLGASLNYQFLGLDPTSATAVGGVVSNAGSVHFGN
jgi:V8-like Glu-specific endopeptidase